MTRGTLLIMFAAVACSVIGQFLLKAGATAVGPIELTGLVSKIVSIAFQPLILIGFMIYGFAALGFIIVLSRADLSVASPLIATSYIFTVLGGNLLFGEVVPPLRWLGIGLIMLGIVFVLRAG